MAAAYRVTYEGPSGGKCPDCVIPIESGESECVGEQAAVIKHTIVSIRGGHWKPHDVVIRKIEYIGPWFSPRKP